MGLISKIEDKLGGKHETDKNAERKEHHYDGRQDPHDVRSHGHGGEGVHAGSAIPGSHANTSSGHSSLPGQHSSSTGGVSHSIPGHQSHTSGAQSSMPGQFPASNTTGPYDNTSSQRGVGSTLQHPISHTGDRSGSGITGGTAVTGSGLTGSHGTHGTSGYGREDPSISTTTDRLHNTHIGNSGTSGTSVTDHATPRQPMDPYSSKGQRAAADAADSRHGYGASQGRAEAGDYGSRASVPAAEVTRTSGGGVSNGMGKGLKTGPHSHLENHDAIPTAGGHKLGSEGAGPGSYDNDRGNGQHGYHDYTGTGTGPASSTIGPHSSNIANIVDPRVGPDPSLQSSTAHQQQQQQHHTGRDAALSGGAGAAGAAAYGAHDKHSHGKHDNHQTGSLSNQTGLSGSDASQSSYNHPSTTHQTSHTIPHGQHTSSMNRSHADEPLSQDKNFAERHPGATAAGVGSGAAALGAGAAHHHQQGTHSGAYDNDGRNNIPGQQTSGLTGHSLPPQSTTTHNMPSHSTGDNFSSPHSGLSGSGNPASTAVSGTSKSTEGLSMAKRMGGAYEAGYRDALEHMRQEREGY